MACPDSEHGVRIPAMEQGGQVKKVMAQRSAGGQGGELVIPNPKLRLMEQVREVMRIRAVDG